MEQDRRPKDEVHTTTVISYLTKIPKITYWKKNNIFYKWGQKIECSHVEELN